MALYPTPQRVRPHRAVVSEGGVSPHGKRRRIVSGVRPPNGRHGQKQALPADQEAKDAEHRSPIRETDVPNGRYRGRVVVLVLTRDS